MEYYKLTKHIELLESSEKNTASTSLKQSPYANPGEPVYNFVVDVYDFVKENTDISFTNYKDILAENGIIFDWHNLPKIAIQHQNALCIVALLYAVCQSEKFCTGIVTVLVKNGTIIRWLRRLQEIEQSKEALN